MSAVSETIVREYFELHGFFVRQQRKYVAPAKREDEEIDFFVLNPRHVTRTVPLPSVLGSDDLPGIARAIVVVKGWHTETFSPAVMESAPEMFRFVEPKAFPQAQRAFGGDEPFTKILVVPALPQAAAARQRSLEFLRGKGIDAVIPFRTMLADLIDHAEVNRNYSKSDLLQAIRILKKYDFFKEPQLELFKARKRSKPKRETE